MSDPNLLLVSSSRLHSHGYLGHVEQPIRQWADGITDVLFIPWALHSHDEYAELAADRLGDLGLNVQSIHDTDHPRAAAAQAQAVFVGGGNTFRLLNRLQQTGVADILKSRTQAGTLRYLGTSAGTNITCPTIQTTNDMPIVWPHTPYGLGLVDYQINVHYIDADPDRTHKSETRLTRLTEYLEDNPDQTIVALREHAWIRIHNNQHHISCHNDHANDATEAGLLLTSTTQQPLHPGLPPDLQP